MTDVNEAETAFELAVAVHVQKVARAKTPRAGVETMRELRARALELAAALLDYASTKTQSSKDRRGHAYAAMRLRENAALARCA